MIQKFKEHLISEFPVLFQSKLLLAVSGGVDSVALCHLCKAVGLDFAIAHCNFHLRDQDSIDDQAFVEQLAKELQVQVYVAEFQTQSYAKANNKSIQIAARELRYTYFEQIRQQYAMDYVLTAHHLDDSIETFFINLTRGTGIDGLLGIPSTNGYIVRPLLCFTRVQIMDYVVKSGFSWKEDYTNAQNKYLRNNIRNQIIPLFKQVAENFSESFYLTIGNLQQSAQLSKDAALMAWEKVTTIRENQVYFSIAEIKKLSSPKAYLYQWLEPYGFQAWFDIEQLVEATSGKVIYSKDYILLKDRDYLILQDRSSFENSNSDKVYWIDQEQEIISPLPLSLQKSQKISTQSGPNVIYLDADLLSFPLQIRKPESGDKFIPLGMKGSKKVSKFFKDEKINIFEKKRTWILTSNNQIVWIIGNRMDDRFKVRSTTTNIIKIELKV
ncbi:tRNA lysidine(34) synthetase TilS [Myroides sp. LJL119]